MAGPVSCASAGALYPNVPSATAPCSTLRRLMSSIMSRSHDSLVGLRLRRAVCGLAERAHDAAAGELDLEGVVGVALGVAQQHIGCARECRGLGCLAAQSSLG